MKNLKANSDNHLEVTLTGACNVLCSYCPQELYIKKFKEIDQREKYTTKRGMTLGDWKKILENVNYTVNDIHFTGYTEPLQCEEWYEIVAYTLEKGYKVSINTTLIGATSSDVKKIIDMNIPVRLHLTDSNKKVDSSIYDQILDYKNLQSIVYFSEKGKNIMQSNTKMSKQLIRSRGGLIENSKDPSYIGPVHCVSTRFLSNVVLPNGDVSVCCSDFGLKNILGNLKEDSLKKIHSSRKLKEFVIDMETSGSNSICKKCHYAYPQNKFEQLKFFINKQYLRIFQKFSDV